MLITRIFSYIGFKMNLILKIFYNLQNCSVKGQVFIISIKNMERKQKNKFNVYLYIHTLYLHSKLNTKGGKKKKIQCLIYIITNGN